MGANHATKATTNEQNGRGVELENLGGSLDIYDDNITVGIVFSVNRTLRNLEGTILNTMNHLEGLVGLLHNRRNLQSSLACGNSTSNDTNRTNSNEDFGGMLLDLEHGLVSNARSGLNEVIEFHKYKSPFTYSQT